MANPKECFGVPLPHIAGDSEGRTIWIAEAHRGGKRYVVRADEILTAFMELQAAIHRRFEAQLESHA